MTRALPHFVNAFTAKGRRYYYFRRPGVKPIRLPDFGTPEFEIAYQKALHNEAPEVGAGRTLPGTLNEAVVGYYGSLAFRELAPATQLLRRVYLEKFREQLRSVPRSGATTSFVWVGSIFVMASYSSANPRPAPNF